MEFDRENPSPLSHLSGAADPQWHDWSPELEAAYLQQLAGVERLEDATSLQLVVNTTIGGSIAHLGGTLPNLVELNLNGSVLDSLRDLGTGFHVLQVLWVSRCGLKGLDGLNGLPALRELYAAYNDIADLQPVDSCQHLEVLDVECNCISDVDSVLYLTPCAQLQTLTLAGNPAAEHPGYRQAVCSALPSLHCLDDQPVTPSDRGQQYTEPHHQSQPNGGAASPTGSPAAVGVPAKSADLLAPPPLKAAAAALAARPPDSPSAAAASGAALVDEAHSISGVPLSAPSVPDAEELALVVAGIKHARVGVDSHEFREIEMNLLVATADGTDVQLDARPGTSALLPASTGTWVRTLRSSREGSLAALRASAAAAAAAAAASAQRSAGSASPASALSASPISSRPPSGHHQYHQYHQAQHHLHQHRHSGSAPQSAAPQERWAVPSGAGAAALGMSHSLGAPAAGNRRPSSGAGGAGGGLSGGAEAPHRPGSGGQRPNSSATNRPFSARPGTAASFSARIGTSASTGATAPVLATAGLYWAKNRISGGSASGGGTAGGGGDGHGHGHGSGAAGSGGGAAASRDADATTASSSKLTQGSETTFGGSLARDLRKWKCAAVRADAAAAAAASDGGGGGAGGDSSGGAAAAAAGAAVLGGGSGLSLTLLRGGQLDPKALLEELKRWKLETADKVLYVDPDEADPAAAAWGSGGERDSFDRERDRDPLGRDGAGGADVLRLSNGHDPLSADLSGLGLGLGLGLLEPALEPASPGVPGSPLQPARPPAGAAAAGRRKMVLAKVMRDIAADSVGDGGASISEILAGLRPVKTSPTHGYGAPGSAWGPPGLGFGGSGGEEQGSGQRERERERGSDAVSPSQYHHQHHRHHHHHHRPAPGQFAHAAQPPPPSSPQQVGVQRAGSARSGCSSSDGLSVPSHSSRPGSRDEATVGAGGGGGAVVYGGPPPQRPTSGSRAPGLPAGPSAPPAGYRVASAAGVVDVRQSNPQPALRRDAG